MLSGGFYYILIERILKSIFMPYFTIKGGKTLKGSIEVKPAKNSAVAILCATCMIPGKTTLTRVPVIEEVKRIIEVLTSIGLQIEWKRSDKLEIINEGNIDLEQLDHEAFSKTRSGILLLGALSSLKDQFSLPKTGGCKLGKRTANPHIMALEHLGFHIEEKTDFHRISQQNPGGTEFVMYESGDTATENAVMAASKLSGTTTIHFASANYMVRDLCHFLNRAGADISGLESSKFSIEGVQELNPVAEYAIMPDPIEAMTLISIAITTGSRITVVGCPIDFLRLELEKLKVMGQKMNISDVYTSESGHFDLVDIEIIPSQLNALDDKIYGRPFPGLNIDNLPLFLPILTQAHGQTLVHDWPYENRAIYYTELNRLGAHTMLHDPHRITITGPTKLQPAEIICPPALRPAVNMVICMLAADGTSILRNGYSIERGYENLVERLNELGAEIEKEE